MELHCQSTYGMGAIYEKAMEESFQAISNLKL